MTNISSLTFPSGRQLEKLSPISVSLKLSFYSAQERITEQEDEFSSPKETIRPAWAVISNCTDSKTLQLWKDWSLNVKDYFGAQCNEVAVIDNRLTAVLALDNAQLINKFPDSKAAQFVAALCDMTIELDKRGFVYKYWGWSNIVSDSDSWKLLPSPSMERTKEPNAKLALSRLGKWLLEINAPFLQTQPARSIIELMANGQIPDCFPEEIAYEEFWGIQKCIEKPLKLNLTQNQNSILLKWDWTLSGETLLFLTDRKKKAVPGQFIWHENVEHYGTPLTNVSGINPIIDTDAGTAQWSRPHDNAKYQKYTITPATRHDNWFEWGVPVIVGGPEEACLQGAYFDPDSNEIVLSPSWSDDRNIAKMYIVIRQDRFAKSVKDYQSAFPPFIVERRLINHPKRIKVKFSSQLYIVAFNAVTNERNIYFSAGQADSCRRILDFETRNSS